MGEEKSLNRQLAELLGYTTFEDTIGFWHLKSPLGVVLNMSLMGEYFAWDGAPDYLHSLDAVMDALPREWYDVNISFLLTGGYEVLIRRDDPPLGYVARWAGRGATRQEAAAKALLAWALAQRKATP